MKIAITNHDRKKYVLKTDLDVRILKLCKKLEQKPLLKDDRYFVRFIKTQLLDDWRKPLEMELKELLKRY